MNKLLQGWNLLRILRLGLGIAAVTQGIVMRDAFAGFIGLLLAGTAVFNVGCCGAGNCSSGSCRVPQKNK